MTAIDKLLVKWPKVLFPVIITAVFGVISPLACGGILYAKFVHGAFPEIGMIGFGFVVLVLAFFTWASIGGFFSSLRNLKEPYTRLEADNNGMSFVVNARKGGNILVPWAEIKEIKQDNVYRGDHHHIDTLHVALYSGSSISLSSIMNAESASGDKEIHLGKDTLDFDLDELIQTLNEMKDKAKW